MIKLIAMLMVMISAGFVYNLKEKTYDLENEKNSIISQIHKDQEAIKVLNAEMAYLSRPERLERLARKHLVLESSVNEQMITDVSALTVRNNMKLATLPIDNFQLLLPRQKPEPKSVTSVNRTTTTVSYENPPEVMEKKSEKNLYDSILAKLGN
jgi:cell division protein FtsL